MLIPRSEDRNRISPHLIQAALLPISPAGASANMADVSVNTNELSVLAMLPVLPFFMRLRSGTDEEPDNVAALPFIYAVPFAELNVCTASNIFFPVIV